MWRDGYAGEPSDLPGVLFDHRDRDVVFHQLVGGGQTGRAGAHDDDVLALAFGDQRGHSINRTN